MPRYDDCESCAFYEIETVICDECEEADQWEPADPMGCIIDLPFDKKQSKPRACSKLKKAA